MDEKQNNDIIDFDVLSLQKSCDDIFSSSEYEDSCSDSEPSSLTDQIQMPSAKTRIADLLQNRVVMNLAAKDFTDKSSPERK